MRTKYFEEGLFRCEKPIPGFKKGKTYKLMVVRENQKTEWVAINDNGIPRIVQRENFSFFS